jgi:hypothetical protein
VSADTAIIFKFFGPIKAGTGYISLEATPVTGEKMDKIEIDILDVSQVTFYTEAYTDTENYHGMMRVKPKSPLPVHQQALTYRMSVTSDAIVEDNDKSTKTYRAIQIIDYEFTLKDVVVPHSTALVPANGAKEVSATRSEFKISFDEPIRIGTSGVVKITRETVDGSATVNSYELGVLNIALSSDNTEVTVSPQSGASGSPPPFFQAAQRGATFTVVVPSGFVVDAEGNPYAGLSAGKYTFAAEDKMAPEVVLDGFHPANRAVGIASTAPVEITFNEPVRAGKGNIVIEGLGFDGDDATCIVSAVDTTQVRFVSNKMTLRCKNGLAGGVIGRTFRVLMEPGVVTDLATNPNSFTGLSKGEFSFSVLDTVLPMLAHAYPTNGTADVPIDVQISIILPKRSTLVLVPSL